MENFGIDLKASGKGERKKAIAHLKRKGYVFGDKDRWKNGRFLYLYVNVGKRRFNYCHRVSEGISLPLPEDWDKFVSYVGDGVEKVVEEVTKEERFKEGDWVYVEGVEEGEGSWTKGTSQKVFRIIDSNPFMPCNYEGNKNKGHYGLKDCILRKATPSEIEVFLKEEAVRRGFVEGVTVDRNGVEIYVNPVVKLENNESSYDDCMDVFLVGGRHVYKQGKWAEIIEEKAPEIGGYKLKRNGGNWCFGCYIFTFDTLIGLLNACCVSSVRVVVIKGQEIPIDKLKEARDYIEKHR